MPRQDDLREVMRSLIAPPVREDSAPALMERRRNWPPVSDTLKLSEPQKKLLEELSTTLHENGIEAAPTKIVQAILDVLMRRPALCRGLLAAYFLDT